MDARRLSGFAVIALVLAGGIVLSGSEPDDVSAKITRANASFSDAYVSGDLDALASLYTEDAVLYPPGRVVEGRDAIRKYFTPGPNRKQLAHRLETMELDVAGNTAIETGTWTSTWQVGERGPVTSSDRYLIVWKRQEDGRWLIHRDWWHRPDRPRTNVDAKPMVVERAEIRTLKSDLNGVAYELYVSLPHSYGAPGKRYPVVYCLDADYSFLVVRNIADHLSERNHLREVIVVGIAYDGELQYRLNRTRDYTPKFVPDGGYGAEYQKVSGGGPKFLEFIENELIPFVDESYTTVKGDRTLSGHSYGGLFTVWTMLTRPDAFNRYIAVSPSLWYDDGLVFRLEDEVAKKGTPIDARLYMCVGSREMNGQHDMVADLEKLAATLKKRRYAGLEVESLVMPDETHNSVYPGGISNGLRFVLEGR